MIKSEFTKLVNDVIKLHLEVAKEYIEELKDMFDFGNPEQVLKKPYEQWGVEEFKVAKAIWGNDPDITRWIARKKIRQVEKLEEEVKEMENG